VPGPNDWDQDVGVYRKRVEPKQVYVDFCKRQLFEAEPKPLVRMGKCLKGRDCYCFVDIFKVKELAQAGLSSASDLIACCLIHIFF